MFWRTTIIFLNNTKTHDTVDWLRWGETDITSCGLYRPIARPWVTVMWTMVWWYWLGLTPNLSTRALWQPLVLSSSPVSRDISGTSRRMGKGNENLVYPSCGTSRDLYNAVKSYDTGPPALLPIWIKVYCGFLSPLKIHCLGQVQTRYLWVQLQAQ
jgi:hypothetical protein